MTQYALEVEDLVLNYPRFHLNKVTFAIPKQCIAGLIGVNGAGKSTTIRIILNLIKAESGRVTINGIDLHKSERYAKESLGVVLDNGGLYDKLTVEQMKDLIATAYKSWDDTIFYRQIEQFGISPDVKISTLSRGTRMKVALAFAVSHHARLLLMDEPTSGLDPLVRKQLLSTLVKYVREEEASVLFSTHITSDLDRTANHIVMMNDGTIVIDEDRELLMDEYTVFECANEQVNANKSGRTLDTDGKTTRILINKAEADKYSTDSSVFSKATLEDIMIGNLAKGKLI